MFLSLLLSLSCVKTAPLESAHAEATEVVLPVPAANERTLAARQALDSGDLEAAYYGFSEALAANPSDAYAQLYMAITLVFSRLEAGNGCVSPAEPTLRRIFTHLERAVQTYPPYAVEIAQMPQFASVKSQVWFGVLSGADLNSSTDVQELIRRAHFVNPPQGAVGSTRELLFRADPIVLNRPYGFSLVLRDEGQHVDPEERGGWHLEGSAIVVQWPERLQTLHLSKSGYLVEINGEAHRMVWTDMPEECSA